MQTISPMVPAISNEEERETDDAPAKPRRWSTGAVIAFVLSGSPLAVFSADMIFGLPRVVQGAVYAWSALIAAAAGVSGLVIGIRLGRIPFPIRPRGRMLAWLAFVSGGFFFFVGALCSILSSVNFSRGRQLRRFGRVLLPKVSAAKNREAWARAESEVRVPNDLRDGLASQWRENARTEHASVAAFARLTLDLMALGAPPDLIAAAQQDALDEIRHAEMCFALARDIDGRALGPAAFPEAARARTLSSVPSIALAQLAVDSLIDGALHEGLSARVVAKLARKSESPRVTSMLRTIAADEGRHAAHGWDVVEWCVREGGDSVLRALAGSLSTLPKGMASSLPIAAEDGSWERYGIMGRALETEEFARARSSLVKRVDALTNRVMLTKAA